MALGRMASLGSVSMFYIYHYTSLRVHRFGTPASLDSLLQAMASANNQLGRLFSKSFSAKRKDSALQRYAVLLQVQEAPCPSTGSVIRKVRE